MRRETVVCDRCHYIEKPGDIQVMRIVHVRLMCQTASLNGGLHEANLCFDCRSSLDRLIACFLGEGENP